MGQSTSAGFGLGAGGVALKLFLAIAFIVLVVMRPLAPTATVWAQSDALLIEGGTILTATQGVIENGAVLVVNGRITAVGKDVKAPAGARKIDARGKFITPGLIDSHSHMGVYPWPGVEANADGNEATDPFTPQVRALDSFWNEDPSIQRAVAGGITTIQVLPGSANLVGGQAAIFKLKMGRSLDAMLVAGAPNNIKMALGENPKRVYGARQQMPSTRMGNIAALREMFIKARDYQRKWDEYNAKNAEERAKASPPDRDLKLDTLAAVLRGEIRPQVHCYRQDEILRMFAVAEEFGFKIAALHHCLEGYKVATEIAKRGAVVCTWPDWYGFKMEAWQTTPYAIKILTDKGVQVAIHSDSADMVQRFHIEAAKMLRYGMTEEQALKLITINPARAIGLENRIGSIEVGKDGDLVIFDRTPFSVYARVDATIIDGQVVYERAK